MSRTVIVNGNKFTIQKGNPVTKRKLSNPYSQVINELKPGEFVIFDKSLKKAVVNSLQTFYRRSRRSKIKYSYTMTSEGIEVSCTKAA